MTDPSRVGDAVSPYAAYPLDPSSAALRLTLPMGIGDINVEHRRACPEAAPGWNPLSGSDFVCIDASRDERRQAVGRFEPRGQQALCLQQRFGRVAGRRQRPIDGSRRAGGRRARCRSSKAGRRGAPSFSPAGKSSCRVWMHVALPAGHTCSARTMYQPVRLRWKPLRRRTTTWRFGPPPKPEIGDCAESRRAV